MEEKWHREGFFAGITHRLPFPCPSVKQPQCVMLKPEARRDMLLFPPLGFPPVLREGSSKGRGSECTHAECLLNLFPVALRLLKAMYSFIIV